MTDIDDFLSRDKSPKLWIKSNERRLIMKNQFVICLLTLTVAGCSSVDVKEAQYDVVKKDGKFEVRDYAPQIVAETIIEGTFENAGDKAFNRLFQYISGNNQSKSKIAMTAPVSQETASEKIKMTAPVAQQKFEDKWVVSFMMPASYTIKSIPEPNDSRIIIRQIPVRRMAAVRYSGFWSKKNYLKNELELQSWMKKQNLIGIGAPIWARYNPPFTLWFLRRNEILIQVDTKTK
jgi:effector-binding domain-containing protein